MLCRKKNRKEPLINKALVPLKVQQFFYTGGTNSIYMYLSLQLRLLGLSIGDITIITLCHDIVSVFGPPIVGFCTDRIGRYKLITGVILGLNATFISCFLFVPQYKYMTKPVIADIKQNIVTVDTCGEIEKCNQTLTSLSLYDCRSNNVSTTHNISQVTPCTSFISSELTLNYSANQSSVHKCLYIIHDVYINESNYVNLHLSPTVHRICYHRCQTETKNKCESIIGQWESTFFTALVIRIFATFFTSAAFNVMDTSIMAGLKRNGGKYGSHRIWAHIAQAIFPFLSGALMDVVKAQTGKTSVWPGYLLLDVCFCICVALLFPITVHQEKMEGSTIKNLKILSTNKRCIILFAQGFFFGLAPGFMGFFLPIFLYNLNSPMYVIGLTKTSSAVSSIFLMFFSDKIVERFGHMNVLCAGIFANAFRFFCYSVIEEPVWAILIEVIRSFSQHLLWVVLAKWSEILSPKGLFSTTLGTIRSLAYGIARGVGVVLGGASLVYFGDRKTFQIVSGIYVLFGVFWLILHYLVLQRFVFVDDSTKNLPTEEDVFEINGPCLQDKMPEEKFETGLSSENDDGKGKSSSQSDLAEANQNGENGNFVRANGQENCAMSPQNGHFVQANEKRTMSKEDGDLV